MKKSLFDLCPLYCGPRHFSGETLSQESALLISHFEIRVSKCSYPMLYASFLLTTETMGFVAWSLKFFDYASLQSIDFAGYSMTIVLVVSGNLGVGSSFVSSAQEQLKRETEA
jgi:hypothetical protein